MKELLAELVIVEDEIARLESQVSHLQKSLQHEKESKDDYIRSVQKPHASKRTPEDITYSASPSPLNSHVPERTGFETKALHFISKAIKGDYNLKDFRLMDKPGNPKSLFSDQKENQFIGEAKILPDKFWMRSGSTLVASHPSPLRDLRHPTPKVALQIFVNKNVTETADRLDVRFSLEMQFVKGKKNISLYCVTPFYLSMTCLNLSNVIF